MKLLGDLGLHSFPGTILFHFLTVNVKISRKINQTSEPKFPDLQKKLEVVVWTCSAIKFLFC